MKDTSSKTRIVALVIVIILTISLLYLFIKPRIDGDDSYKNVKETDSGQVEIVQAYVTVNAYPYDSDGNGTEDTAVVTYSPLVNITTQKDIKKVTVANVKVNNPVKGDSEFITWPSHYGKLESSNGYYQPMGTPIDYEAVKSSGSSFTYNIVESPSYTDELGINGGYFDFKYSIVGVGSRFDSENILNSQKVFSGGKALQYAGVKKDGIKSPISFDVIVEFEESERAVKRFSLSTNFDEVYNQGFSFENNQEEYLGKKF